MELTKAEKGERKLVKNGYIYVFKKVLASDKVRANVFCEEKVGNDAQQSKSLPLTSSLKKSTTTHMHLLLHKSK